MSPGSGFRLALACVLFAAGLLAVCKPPSYSFWKLSIVIMEGGHFLVAPCLLLALWSLRAGGSGKPAAALFLGAALLHGFTSLRAPGTAASLDKAFRAAWGQAEPPPGGFRQARPLSLAALFRGIPLPAIVPETLVYARKQERDLRLDFYPAAGSRPAPCVVVVHGGGWDGGARSQLAPLNAYLAGQGYAVATLEYRLAPGHLYPAPVEDVADAMAFLRARAGGLGIDTARFVLLGRSAGGQIALQAAYTSQDPSIKGVIAFYAPADMVWGYSLPTNPLIMDSRALMEAYLGGGYAEYPERYAASSPVESATAAAPPTLLLQGRPDVLVSRLHAVHLRAKLDSLGVRNFTVDLPWAAHGFDYVFRGPGSQISLYFIERFLAEVVPLSGRAEVRPGA